MKLRSRSKLLLLSISHRSAALFPSPSTLTKRPTRWDASEPMHSNWDGQGVGFEDVDDQWKTTSVTHRQTESQLTAHKEGANASSTRGPPVDTLTRDV